MPLELIIILASLLITWFVFNWLVNVLKASISTALAIAIVILILQLLFGISHQELWQQILTLPQTLWELLFGS